MAIDVAVVGAGPMGLTAARVAAVAGARTVVFERKAEADPPSCCTGLISARTLPELGVSSDAVLREIYAVHVHFPGGRRIAFRSSAVKAVVIDRTRLESELRLLAKEAGAELRFGVEVVGAGPGTLSVRSSESTQQLHATVVVGADGPRSRIADWLALGQPSQFVAAAQVELEEHSLDDGVEVYIGESVAPGFFGWRVPAQEGVVRVGLAVAPPRRPGVFLERLLAERFPTARVLSRSAGWIPLSMAPKIATPGALLVGDAAGHVKPLSGGGLYTGGVCARFAGEAAAAQAASAMQLGECGDQAADALNHYAQRCLEAIGKELTFGRSIRHHLSRFRDTDIESVAAVLDDSPLLQYVADHADIDRLHQLPDLLASEPRLWSTLLRILPVLGASGN
jgi:digeranylgeranylglycerophospholipid reductase